jgi:regulatory protein
MESTIYPKLMERALRFVSMRPRSTKEVREFLARTLTRHHTTAPSVVKKIMTRLVELGYVNDRTFTEWWITQRRTATPKGTMLIKRELLQKGIAKEDIEAALPKEGEKEAALRAVGRRTKWERRQLWAFLMRRGFAADTIRSVVDDILGKEYNTDI